MLYRVFRESRHGLALSIALNLALLAAGFLIALVGDAADGVVQQGWGLGIFSGFAIGVTFVAVANILLELAGPSR